MYLVKQNSFDGIMKYAERVPTFKPNYPQIIQKGLSMGKGMSVEGIESLKMFADAVIQKMNPSE